jgi:hypothetical protein
LIRKIKRKRKESGEYQDVAIDNEIEVAHAEEKDSG